MHPTSRDSHSDCRDRRDKRGRRIGHNWWREYICEMLLDADLTWLAAREAACNGWPTEEREYQMAHPRPTLKDFLIRCAGMKDRAEAA